MEYKTAVKGNISQKWEYKAILVGLDAYKNIGLVNQALNSYYNWELVSVDNGVAYFKRPVDQNEQQQFKAGA